MSHYENIVISGGGIKGFAFLGALSFVSSYVDISNINTLIGTSVGSMICYLLAIGYTPQEILTEIMSSGIIQKLKGFNIMACIQGEGAFSFVMIQDFLEKKTIQKIGQLLTLQKLKELTGKTLRVVTYNMKTRSGEVLDAETSPDLPCLTAIRMSSNIPYIFAPYRYKDGIYLDGGLVNNFPLDLAVGKSLAFVVDPEHVENQDFTEFIFLKFSMKLMSISVVSNTKEKIKLFSDNHEVIKIKVNKTNGVDFSLTHSEQLDMYSEGYTSAKENYMAH